MQKHVGMVFVPIIAVFSLLVGAEGFGPERASAAATVAAASGPAGGSLLADIQSSQKLKVGWAEWNPLEYRDVASNSLKGMLIDMAAKLAGDLGTKPEFVEDSWATLASGVATGKFNVALEGITTERAKIVDFSHPLYQTAFTAIVPKGSPYGSWSDLNKANVSISVTTGSNTDQLLTELSQAGKIKAHIIRIKDVGAGVLAMASGQVQAYTDQKDALISVTSSHPEYRLVTGSYGVAQFGIAVPKGQPTFKAAVDKAVVSMLKDGTVKELLAQYHIVGNEPAAAR
ncbi:MAG: amino acid ABC transporter substrate-binding protein [bacterium]|nr:amino acid ABC transporter substrate-binding protein [bacterium]